MKILVLGASGMLGSAVIRLFADQDGYEITGSVRSSHSATLLSEELRENLVVGVDATNMDHIAFVLGSVEPDVVINCIGLVKQLANVDDPLEAIPINALLPHRLARLSALISARFIHISTDCVFSGQDGCYVESDFADARDLYGRSKFLGEVDYPNAITLRTSIIGHELAGARSLLGWFLAQEGGVRGFSKAVFSGLPTVVLAQIIRDHVLPNPGLRGLWHVSAEPIDKLSLLRLVAEAYDKDIAIEPDESLIIDRSLDSTRFREATGFSPPTWPDLVETMREFG